MHRKPFQMGLGNSNMEIGLNFMLDALPPPPLSITTPVSTNNKGVFMQAFLIRLVVMLIGLVSIPAMATTYTLNSGNYSKIEGTTFTSAMKPTGWFKTSSPIPVTVAPKAVDIGVKGLNIITDWSFTDGAGHTLTPANSSINSGKTDPNEASFDVQTDANGNVIRAGFYIVSPALAGAPALNVRYSGIGIGGLDETGINFFDVTCLTASCDSQDNSEIIHGDAYAPFSGFSSSDAMVGLVLSGLTGLWWNPNESGWGMSLTQRGSVNFAAWYTYDASGKPTWYVMSSCTMVDKSCAGDIYEVKGGTPLGVAWKGGIAVAKVGTGTLAFTDINAGTFNYLVNGVSGSRNIARQPITTPLDPWGNDYSALWYAAPAESEAGWGIAFTHQKGVIFATMFTYDTSGNPVWYAASNCVVTGNSCAGDLYHVTGGTAPTVAWTGKPAATSIGNIRVRFNNNADGSLSSDHGGTMDYTINGVTGTKAITKQLF